MESIKKRIAEMDRFAKRADIELVELGEGYAEARMPVSDHHLNAVDTVQGGAIFTLADLAFAAASNSHGTVAVAVNVSISFLRAAKSGSTLRAEATEVSKSRKLGHYIVRVTDEDGNLCAVFNGTAYRKSEPIPVSSL